MERGPLANGWADQWWTLARNGWAEPAAEPPATSHVFLASSGEVDYPMLIAEFAPGMIIEIGSGSGGCALWLADVAEAHGLGPVIISIDRTAVDLTDDRVSFRTGDVGHLDEVLTDCGALTRPWLVIEDAHVRTCRTSSPPD